MQLQKKETINTNEGCQVLFKCLTRNDCCLFIHQFLVFFSPDILFPVKSLKISIRGKCGQFFFFRRTMIMGKFFFLLVSFNLFFFLSNRRLMSIDLILRQMMIVFMYNHASGEMDLLLENSTMVPFFKKLDSCGEKAKCFLCRF